MFALLRRLRSVDENDNASRRSLSGSGPNDHGSPPPTPSTKLRDKLDKLEEWRIDPSSIEFEEDACEFCGGFATVSRASLVSTSGTKNNVDNPARARRKNKSDGRPTTRKAVAVKKMKIENGKDTERVLGLALREAGFLMELSHENVVKLEGFIEDLSEDSYRIWLVFPWAANGNLKDFIASEEWEIPERMSLSNDVVRGVEYLHSQDPPIYHGDLKSVNVLVNSEYRAVITDFGCARRLAKIDLDAQREKSENGAQPVLLLETKICEATNTITLTGNKYTLRWAAPELLMDDEPGLWSDIWALGWIFYEVMTNAIPFHNVRKDSMVVIHVIQGKLPCASDHIRISLIRRLYSLMITCWSIDPTKRPTAEDCQKSMNWMPMVVPDPQRASKTSGSRPRSPELLTKMGDMHRLQNDYNNASKFYSEALGISTETEDDEKKADALLGLAHIHKLQNKYRAAAAFYFEVARICTDIGNKEGRANALFGLAEVHRAQNEYGEAVLYYSEVVQICTDLGNVQRRANALWGLAEVHRARNEYTEAVTFYSEVVQIYTDLGCRQQRADALFGLAEVHRAQNEYSEALTFYSEVVQICTDLGIRQGRATALCGLAELHRAQNEYDKAVTFYSEVVQICTNIGNRQRRADALWGLAEVHRLQHKYNEAVTLYSEVVQICTEVGNRHRKADALRGLAHVHLAQDKYGEAVALYSEAVQIFTDIGNRGGTADALWGLAEVHRLQKRYSKAFKLFSEALQIRTDIGDRNGRAWALMCLADVHRDQDQHEGAIRLYEQATEIFGEIGNTIDAEKALYRAANASRQLNPAEAG